MMTETLRFQNKSLAHKFYFAMCLWMAGIAVVGFWPSFWGHLAVGTLEMKTVLKIHGFVFTG